MRWLFLFNRFWDKLLSSYFQPQIKGLLEVRKLCKHWMDSSFLNNLRFCLPTLFQHDWPLNIRCPYLNIDYYESNREPQRRLNNRIEHLYLICCDIDSLQFCTQGHYLIKTHGHKIVFGEDIQVLRRVNKIFENPNCTCSAVVDWMDSIER